MGREIERTFFNQTRTTAYGPAENSQSVAGVVTGDLNAVDADGDPLSFTVTDGPQNGSVVVNADGTFVYTPSAQLAATGGTDVFTVKVEDQGAHLHGLLGFFQPDFGHSTTAIVAVTVDAINPVIATIAVGDSPGDMAISPDGASVYVANASGDSVSVIDTATDTVIATIGVGDGPCARNSSARPAQSSTPSCASSSPSTVTTTAISAGSLTPSASLPSAAPHRTGQQPRWRVTVNGGHPWLAGVTELAGPVDADHPVSRGQ